jgi:hypothetical protein
MKEKQSLDFHGFIYFRFTNSQVWPKIYIYKAVQAVDLGGGGGHELPIILFLQRKKFQPVKANQLDNNIKSEQKGNKILFFLFSLFCG